MEKQGESAPPSVFRFREATEGEAGGNCEAKQQTGADKRERGGARGGEKERQSADLPPILTGGDERIGAVKLYPVQLSGSSRYHLTPISPPPSLQTWCLDSSPAQP